MKKLASAFHGKAAKMMRPADDEMEIFFLKLRIPTLTFSKDTNWIIGEPTGAAAWLGIKRPTNNRTSRSDEMLVTL